MIRTRPCPCRQCLAVWIVALCCRLRATSPLDSHRQGRSPCRQGSGNREGGGGWSGPDHQPRFMSRSPAGLTARQPLALILRWGALDEGNDEASDMGFDGRGTASEKFYWRPVAPHPRIRASSRWAAKCVPWLPPEPRPPRCLRPCPLSGSIVTVTSHVMARRSAAVNRKTRPFLFWG